MKSHDSVKPKRVQMCEFCSAMSERVRFSFNA